MATKKKVTLVPELVPASLWGRSAYRMLGGRAVWKKQIRGDALTQANSRCSLCRSDVGRLICHDKWQYDDKRAVATLVGFEIHCPACDAVTHLGRTFTSEPSEEREEIVRSAIEHLCEVNKCTQQTAQEIVLTALDQWIKRSNKNWTIKVATSLLKEYPELAPLPEFVPPLTSF